MEENELGKTMEITLKKIGMLDEARLEIGDITLICGENNTGKTYVTYSLYGYLDYIQGLGYSSLYKIFSENCSIYDDVLQIEIKKISEIFENISQHLNNLFKEKLPDILAGRADNFKESDFCENSLTRLVDSFSKDTQNIIDFFGSLESIECKIDLEYVNFSFKQNELFLKKESDDVKKVKFVVIILSHVFTKIYPLPFILSAERTGASMFQKELDVNKNEIVEEISKVDGNNMESIVSSVLNRRYSRYPKPVKDNIYFVRSVDEVSKKISFIKKEEKNNPLYAHILEILYKIVGGKYLISEEGIEFAPGAKQRVTKGKFAIQRASSSVRSLLILNLYILHVAQKNDILMIDEPELNLHPKNQILLTRLLVLLANAGIKIFITTHSDYIVRELGNCIMLNNLSDEQIGKFLEKGYNINCKINYKSVKAYLAKEIKGKNVLQAIEVTSNEGIFMDTFDEPIDSQNENQGKIYEEILYRRAHDDK